MNNSKANSERRKFTKFPGPWLEVISMDYLRKYALQQNLKICSSFTDNFFGLFLHLGTRCTTSIVLDDIKLMTTSNNNKNYFKIEKVFHSCQKSKKRSQKICQSLGPISYLFLQNINSFEYKNWILTFQILSNRLLKFLKFACFITLEWGSNQGP